MHGYSPIFTSFGNNAYESDVVRSTIHAIASNAAKLRPRHVRRKENGVSLPRSQLERLLSVRPNPHMNAYDFYYKVVTQLYMRSNAFILIHSDGMRTIGFYPVVAQTVETLEYDNELYLRFGFSSGKTMTVHYDEVIHLRRFFNDSDIFGSPNEKPLLPTLELINTTNQGIGNAVKSSAYLRGLLKFSGMLKPDDLKKRRDAFISDYLDASNNGGIAATDSNAEYVPLTSDPKMVDARQMATIETKVYKFFNVNEAIVTSKYTENDWSAFYESVLEPLAVQMSLEFTSKLFTDNEQSHGNEIMFEANRLQYASTTTKISVIKELTDRGMLSKNEGREIFNLSPVPGGDEYIVSLNYVKANEQSQYQLGNDTPANSEPENGGEVNNDDDEGDEQAED